MLAKSRTKGLCVPSKSNSSTKRRRFGKVICSLQIMRSVETKKQLMFPISKGIGVTEK